MTIRHVKDVILFRMDAAEMRQVMEAESMVHSVWLTFLADSQAALRSRRWLVHEFPLKIFHEEDGRGHVLQCRVQLWEYFKEAEASNPLEQEIRSEMLSVGLSGEAARLAARYAAPARQETLNL